MTKNKFIQTAAIAFTSALISSDDNMDKKHMAVFAKYSVCKGIELAAELEAQDIEWEED